MLKPITTVVDSPIARPAGAAMLCCLLLFLTSDVGEAEKLTSEVSSQRYALTLEDDTEDSFSCEGDFDVSHPCSSAVDEDWDTYAIPLEAGGVSYIYENFAIPSNAGSAQWTGKYEHTAPVTPGHPYSVTGYWNGTDWVLFCGGESNSVITNTSEIPHEALLGGVLQLRTQVAKSTGALGSGDIRYYEGEVTWYMSPQLVPVSSAFEKMLLGSALAGLALYGIVRRTRRAQNQHPPNKPLQPTALRGG